MRVLILGGTGFCGTHLARSYLADGAEVFITGRKRREGMASGAEFLEVDTADSDQLGLAIGRARPDRVFHLAGLASVARSFEGEERVYQVNVLGTFHVLKALRRGCPEARILVAGSAEEYGPAAAADLPIGESAALRPVSPYGVSRVASTLMSLREATPINKDGLSLVATRTFNLTGPGQSRTYVCADFAGQAAEAVVRGDGELVMTTGNLEVRRDFSSVEEGMKAYRALIEKGESGRVYNVCSGRAIRISRIVEMLAEISGLEIRTELDPGRLRKGEVEEVRGDASALYEATGLRLSEEGLRRALEGLFEESLRRVRAKRD